MGLNNKFWQTATRALVVSLSLLFTLAVFSVPASAKFASFVIDADTGEVLNSVNADTRNYPASLTKMMTLYLVFENLQAGTLALDDTFTVTRRATRQPPSRLGLSAGEKITVEEAIYALVAKSANDIAVTVAESLAKSERDFALKMTATARRIGMRNTTFRNASGLPHRGQMSTARDMAILAKHLIVDFPEYYPYFSTEEFEHNGQTYKNHNNLLTTYNGVDGIKTGYIRASGFNLVASVKRNGHRLIGVVFGGKTSKRRDHHMAALLNRGFAELGGEGMVAKSDAQKDNKSPVYSWGIQVGAYHQSEQAASYAETAFNKISHIVKYGEVRVEPLKQKRRKTVFRSRVINATKKEAYSACRELKRQKIACMVLKVDEPLRVAER